MLKIMQCFEAASVPSFGVPAGQPICSRLYAGRVRSRYTSLLLSC